MEQGKVQIVLCAPGKFEEPERLAELFGSEVTIEVEPRDSAMAAAFKGWISPLRPTLDASDLARIREHRSVVYAVSQKFAAGDAARLAHHVLRVGGRLLQEGAVALKCESSGVAHGPAAWKEYLALADASHTKSRDQSLNEEAQLALRIEFWRALRDAFLQNPIADDDSIYTCGMHLLGEADAAMSRADAAATPDAAALLDELCLYTLAESEVGDGDTFRRVARDPAWIVRMRACNAHEADDLFFNPYGMAWLTR